MISTARFEQLLSDLINGNQSDYKRKLNALSKRLLVQFIHYATDMGHSLPDIKLHLIGDK